MAKSVPGVGCRWIAARRAVGVARGSMTINVPFAADCSVRYRARGGIVSVTLAPASKRVSAPARSASGNGRPRSIPKARIPAAAADDIQKRPL
jgi:hypothetical protein